MRSYLLAIAFACSILSACGDDDSSSDSPGSGGSSGSSARGGSTGSGGAARGGANSGGAVTSGGRGGTGQSGEGGESDSGGSSGMPATGGSDPGGAPGTGGDPATGGMGEAGAGGTPPLGECGAIETFEDGLAPERELFVDAAAAGPGDGSAADPFPTLEAAVAEAAPGTAIRILPGTYDGGAFFGNLQGTADAPIWLGGVDGQERPLLSGGDNGFQLSRASYLVVHDLEVTGQSANGINCDDGSEYADETAAHHLIFRGLLIRDLGDGGNQDCLKLSGINDFWVLDSEFRGCSGGSAIDHVGCHRGVIADNLFVDLGGNGVQSKGGSVDILITRNRFFEAGERAVNMGGSTGFEFFRPPLSTSEPNTEARDIRVISNLFRGGISPIAFVGCVDCIAAHNTVVDPQNWVFRILQETTSEGEYEFLPAQNGRFVNNLVYFERGALSTYINVGGETDPESFELANNLWYAYDDVGQSEPNPLPAPEADGIYGEDPAFTDAVGLDFSIDSASPAAGAGLALGFDAGDFRGNCYPDPPSIGAYEPL